MRFDQLDEYEKRAFALPSGKRLPLYLVWCEAAGPDPSAWDEEHLAKRMEHDAALRRNADADRLSVVQVDKVPPAGFDRHGGQVATRGGHPCACAACGRWLRIAEISCEQGDERM